ncbi:MAG: hypothetical protein Q8M03_04060 [Legionella sp.]|nr:hypothetical protein [Legionella sp.]
MYVFPDSCISALTSIRTDFEEISKTSLDKASQPYAFAAFFGATDVKSRDWQTIFILDWLKIFKDDLKPIELLDSEDSIQKSINAKRVIVALRNFLEAEIEKKYILRSGSNATLMRLMDSAFQIDSKNPMDEETRACCLFAAQSFLSTTSVDTIKSKHNVVFQTSPWRKFSNHITSECRKLEETHPSSYPITSILSPALALSMGLIGNTVGFIAGDAFGKSTLFYPARYTITTALGSGILFIVGPGANMGVLLLAPSIAGKLLDRFCGLTLGGIMGVTMSTVGSGVGWAVGRSLDGVWSLFYQACCQLIGTNSELPLPPITGFTLVDPRRINNGCEITVSETPQYPEGYEAHPVTITDENGEITIRIQEEKVEPLNPDNPAYQAVIDQLKANQETKFELPDSIVDASTGLALAATL